MRQGRLPTSREDRQEGVDASVPRNHSTILAAFPPSAIRPNTTTTATNSSSSSSRRHSSPPPPHTCNQLNRNPDQHSMGGRAHTRGSRFRSLAVSAQWTIAVSHLNPMRPRLRPRRRPRRRPTRHGKRQRQRKRRGSLPWRPEGEAVLRHEGAGPCTGLAPGMHLSSCERGPGCSCNLPR